MPLPVTFKRPPSSVDHEKVLRDFFAEARAQNPTMHHTWLMALIWKRRPERSSLDTCCGWPGNSSEQREVRHGRQTSARGARAKLLLDDPVRAHDAIMRAIEVPVPGLVHKDYGAGSAEPIVPDDDNGQQQHMPLPDELIDSLAEVLV
jgi:hypothetical protein